MGGVALWQSRSAIVSTAVQDGLTSDKCDIDKCGAKMALPVRKGESVYGA